MFFVFLCRIPVPDQTLDVSTQVRLMSGRRPRLLIRQFSQALPIVDLQTDSTGADASLSLRLGKEGQRRFDLAADLLFRSTLFRLADDQHILQLTIHHLACDGWSLRFCSMNLENQLKQD